MPREVFYDASIILTGYSPTIMHKMSVAALKPKSRGSQTSSENPEEWKLTTHLDSDGHVCLMNETIRALIHHSSKGEKIGKLFLSKIAPVGIFVPEISYKIEMPINGKYRPITIEDIEKNQWTLVAPVVIKSGGRVTRYRTCLPAGWRVSLIVSILDPNLSIQVVKDLFEKAGYASGIGCWRPGSPKPGVYGQFDATVTKLSISHAEVA